MKNPIQIYLVLLLLPGMSCNTDNFDLPQPDGRLLGLEVDFTVRDPNTGEIVENQFEGFYRNNETVEIGLQSNKEIGRIEVVNSATSEVIYENEINGGSADFSIDVADLGIPFGQSSDLLFHLFFDDVGIDGFDYPSIKSYAFTVNDEIPSVVKLVDQNQAETELRALNFNIDEFFNDPDRGVSVSFKGDEFSYLEVEDNPALHFGSDKDFSVSFWVDSDHDISDPAIMGTMDWASSGNKGWVLAWLRGRLRVVIGDGEGSKTDFRMDEGQSILGTGWRFITVSFDRDTQVTLYIDGQEIASAPSQPLDIDNGNTIKINQDGEGDYGDRLAAKFSQINFYGYVLNAGEVMAIYESSN